MKQWRLPINFDPRAQADAVVKRRCELSLSEFVKAAWSIVEPENKYVHNWHVEFICLHLEAVARGDVLDDGEIYNRLLINVPPGMMKSLLVGVFFPAWVWGPMDKAGKRFLSVTHSEDLTIRDTNNFRVLVMSEWYQRLWGKRVKIKRATVQMIENSKRGFRQAATWGGITGKRADHVLIDDPHSVKTAESDAERTTTVRLFREAIPLRLVSPIHSSITVVMQRLHQDDVSGTIIEEDLGFDHICLPMRYDNIRNVPTKLGYQDIRTKPGELLFPERFPQHVVDRDEKILGEFAVAGQMQQEPSPRGGGIIKDAWWRLWEKDQYPPTMFRVASLDTALTEKTQNDPSALTVWGVFSSSSINQATRSIDRYGKAYDLTQSYDTVGSAAVPNAMMMYGWQDRLTLHKLVLKVVELCRKFDVDVLLIENKASGHSVRQELNRLFGNEDFHVRMYDPGAMDKFARLNSVQHIFEEKMVWAPEKDWADMVIQQVSRFPRGSHDDLVDTVSMALRHLRDIGMLTRSPERLAEIEASKKFHGNKGAEPLYNT